MIGRRLRCPARKPCWEVRLLYARTPLCPACELTELGWRTWRRFRWHLGKLVGSTDLFEWSDIRPDIMFQRMADSGYGWHDDEAKFKDSWVTAVGFWGVRKIEIAQALQAVLAGEWRGDNYEGIPTWQQRLYRAKAATCLVLGRYFEPTESERHFDGIGVAMWNYNEYGTPDGPGGSCDELYVGIGLRDWRVDIEHESWP